VLSGNSTLVGDNDTEERGTEEKHTERTVGNHRLTIDGIDAFKDVLWIVLALMLSYWVALTLGVRAFSSL